MKLTIPYEDGVKPISKQGAKRHRAHFAEPHKTKTGAVPNTMNAVQVTLTASLLLSIVTRSGGFIIVVKDCNGML